MVCHGGSIGGTSYVGLGNSHLDLAVAPDDLTRADGRLRPALFTLNTTRGTVNAGADLGPPAQPPQPRPFAADVPARPRREPPRDGHARLVDPRPQVDDVLRRPHRRPTPSAPTCSSCSARSLSQEFKDLEPTFRDIQAYLKSLKPPKYPFPIDRPRADRGSAVFAKSCARCHGTYGPDGEYPNEIVELDVIGTDPARALGISDRLIAHYNTTWFGEDHPADEEMVGYQAPPLDGVWATAPYLHNGSVPTLARPAQVLRPPRPVPPPALHRLRALRHGERRLEVRARDHPSRPDPARRTRPDSSTTPRDSASATAATPSATSSPTTIGRT